MKTITFKINILFVKNLMPNPKTKQWYLQDEGAVNDISVYTLHFYDHSEYSSSLVSLYQSVF